MQTNRIIRECDAGSFIRMHLRDEDSNMLSTLFGNLDRVVDRIYSLMMDGIKIGDRTYRYLASSNSQMRNHSCYFIEDNDGTVAESIRSRIGDLSGQLNFNLTSFELVGQVSLTWHSTCPELDWRSRRRPGQSESRTTRSYLTSLPLAEHTRSPTESA